MAMIFSGGNFQRILAQNERKSQRRAATARYKADIEAESRMAAAKTAKPRAIPKLAAMSTKPADLGMKKAELAAEVQREGIEQRGSAARMASREQARATGLQAEIFEFEKSLLKKKKKSEGLTPAEEIEEMVATPRY